MTRRVNENKGQKQNTGEKSGELALKLFKHVQRQGINKAVFIKVHSFYTVKGWCDIEPRMLLVLIISIKMCCMD